jgi:uncharacterized iron-regulated membrane protein
VVRRVWVVAHRWAGLTIALFLVVAGLTGSLLAFHDELDVLAAPQLHRVTPPSSNAALLDPLVLRDRVTAALPGAVVNTIPLHFTPRRSVVLNIERRDPQTGALSPWSRDWDEAFVDPYTGRIIGHRLYGDIGAGWVNLMPFVYHLHYTLALGAWGQFAFGIAAMIWTLDCFVGLYLTWPVRRRMPGGAQPRRALGDWWRGWRPAWRVRWRGGPAKLTFDLHRAGALWIWPLLFVFAWSAVSFTLPPVYDPVMRLFGYTRLQDGISARAHPQPPRLDFRAAMVRGRALADAGRQRFGYTIDPSRESALMYRPEAGLYVYIFTSSADMRDTGGRSLAMFDTDSGNEVKLVIPQGQRAANTFNEWISAIHMASVAGLPGRIATTLIGLAVTMLTVTGVLIWSRRRAAHIVAARRHSADL